MNRSLKRLSWHLVSVTTGLVLCFLASVNPVYADYVTTVQSFSPVAYWTFDDADTLGTAHNSGSGGVANDGAYVGVTLVSSTLSGIPGKAASFSGNSSYVAASDAGFATGINARTQMAWFQTTGGGAYNAIFSYGTFGGMRPGEYSDLFLNPDRNLCGGGGFNEGTNWIRNSTVVNDGKWHLGAFTVGDGAPGLWKLYLDGNLVNSGTLNNSTVLGNTSASAVIGNEPGAFQASWSGLIDDVALFNTALTASQINNLYELGHVPEPSAMLLASSGGLASLLAHVWRRRKCAPSQS